MTREPKWPTLTADESPEAIRAFVVAATDRLYPSSDASDDERAFLTGQILGLLSRLTRLMEAHKS